MKILKHYRVELAQTLTGHWYNVWEQKKKGEIFLGTFPSSTTILNAYPQSPHLTKWIADQGWNESQRIKSEAGEKGTTVHTAVELLLKGEELLGAGMKSHFELNKVLSLEEWYKINTFVAWYREYSPETIGIEVRVFSKKGKYAGTFDWLGIINGEVTLLDWKTSS